MKSKFHYFLCRSCPFIKITLVYQVLILPFLKIWCRGLKKLSWEKWRGRSLFIRQGRKGWGWGKSKNPSLFSIDGLGCMVTSPLEGTRTVGCWGDHRRWVRSKTTRKDRIFWSCVPTERGRNKGWNNERNPCRSSRSSSSDLRRRCLGTWKRRRTTDTDWNRTDDGDTGSGIGIKPRYDLVIGNHRHNGFRRNRYDGSSSLVLKTTATVNWRYTGRH